MPRMSKKRKQEWALLKRIKLLSARIDSLTDENKTLNNKLDSTKNELVQYKNDNKLLKIRLDDVKEQNSVLQTKVNDHNHSMLTMSKKLNRSEVKKYVDAFLVIIGLLIIVGTVIYYLFYNLNSTTMYAICGIVLVVMIFLLYIRNYKHNHYGGTNSKMIFLMHINPIIIDFMCELSFLNKRVSLVYGDTLLTVYFSFSST